VPHRVTYTVEAKAASDAMSPDRRMLLQRGLARLALNPYHQASAHVSGHEHDRRVQVAPGLMIEYLIAHRQPVVVVVTIFDEASREEE
jgi:hypothetical protein